MVHHREGGSVKSGVLVLLAYVPVALENDPLDDPPTD